MRGIQTLYWQSQCLGLPGIRASVSWGEKRYVCDICNL
nr:MAG TPA: Monocytic leukemia zinc finger protein finger, acetyl transferase, DNA [Crassvirales sp.]